MRSRAFIKRKYTIAYERINLKFFFHTMTTRWFARIDKFSRDTLIKRKTQVILCSSYGKYRGNPFQTRHEIHAIADNAIVIWRKNTPNDAYSNSNIMRAEILMRLVKRTPSPFPPHASEKFHSSPGHNFGVSRIRSNIVGSFFYYFPPPSSDILENSVEKT